MARQFFPPEQRFRGDLPKVPACGACSRRKQRVEDVVGVYFLLGHASAATTSVLEDRVPRTLAKNLGLHRRLRRAIKRAWVPDSSGLRVPGFVIRLGPRELRAARDWFAFVARGLYRWETCSPLPRDHSLFLLKPETSSQYRAVRDLIHRDPGHQLRSLASGEFTYAYALNAEHALSLWLIAFKSIEVAAATVGPNTPTLLRGDLERAQWVE